MRILLVHNYYGSSAPSGENVVYDSEKRLLEANGHEVIEYTRHSDEIRSSGLVGKSKGAASTPWNWFSVRKIRKILHDEKPAVMHVHNTFPLLSPGIFYAARHSQTATVLTLHNFRIFCAAGIPLRNGVVCTKCIDEKSTMSSLRYGCYRGSRVATAPLAASIALHRRLGTWRNEVDGYIALTNSQKNTLVEGGLPAEKVKVKPHFYTEPAHPLPWSRREEKFVYVGRIGQEKGVRDLVEAWIAWGASAPRLDIIGTGPDRDALIKNYQDRGCAGRIRFLGHLPFDEAQQEISSARMLIVPSVCFEGFPLVIREAFALGVPVAASGLGSMLDLIQNKSNGVHFKAGDPQDLLKTVSLAWELCAADEHL